MNDTAHTWNVESESELLDFYDHAFDDAFRCAARLTRGDRVAAEDLVQDAFVKLVRAIRSGDVAEVGVGWLITTVRRRFIDRLRSTEREARRMRLVAADPVINDQPSLEVPALLSGLSERERAALIFRYVDDLPVAEVAELLDTTVRATESLLQRAKRNVRGSEGAS